MKRHKVIALSILIFLASSDSHSRAKQPVLIGFDRDYPPYAYVDEHGYPAGIYTDILNLAFARLDDYEVSLQGYPWKRLMKLIEQGEILGAYPPYYWPDRRPWMHPYSVPIITERVALYCNRERVPPRVNPLRLKWPDSYFGYLIGNDKGFETPGPEFFKALAENRISMHEDSTTRNVKLLLLGRIDCYVNGELSILTAIQSHSTNHQLNHRIDNIYRAMVIRENEGFVGYTRKDERFPFKADFVEQLDAVLKEMKSSGTIEAIEMRYRDAKPAAIAAPASDSAIQ